MPIEDYLHLQQTLPDLQLKDVTAAFGRLSKDDQTALISFLQTLRAPKDATPVAVVAK